MSATATDQPRLSWRRRRRLKRRSRPMYRRADRAIARSLAALMLPLAGVAATAWYYLHQDDLRAALIAAAATAAAGLILSPFALWWAVSGLRRGTRLVITGVLCGTVSGIGTVGLVVGVYAAAAGWVLLTGQPLPEPFQGVQVPLPPGIH